MKNSANPLLSPMSNELYSGYPITIRLANNVDIEFVWCTPGNFMMGANANDEFADNHERPQHQVTLTQGFWMASTPLTSEQWVAFLDANRIFTWNDDSLPASGMTWKDAKLFANILDTYLKDKHVITNRHEVNLPTEAQWEYGCRAGTTTIWYFGNDSSILERYAWLNTNSEDRLHSVKQKLPNNWGIYDLYGNVAEWCLDDYHRFTEQTRIDPIYTHQDPYVKIVRGGYFDSQFSVCRSSARGILSTNNTYNSEVGLRLVINSQ
jgi:formylglycine-generating enzyme required for sulfatase activity